jgi:hypothetical protein
LFRVDSLSVQTVAGAVLKMTTTKPLLQLFRLPHPQRVAVRRLVFLCFVCVFVCFFRVFVFPCSSSISSFPSFSFFLSIVFFSVIYQTALRPLQSSSFVSALSSPPSSSASTPSSSPLTGTADPAALDRYTALFSRLFHEV